MNDPTILKILKRGITRKSPSLPSLLTDNVVLKVLDDLFLSSKMVFAGLISEHVEKALATARFDTFQILNWFDQLRDAGWIIIDGDTFTPTQIFIDRYG